MPAFAETMSPLEKAPRRALLWGAGLLVLGLATVGVGREDEGAVLTLVGLVVTLFGIHKFGRLGPDDAAETARHLQKVTRGEAKVEKRRRLGKSRAP